MKRFSPLRINSPDLRPTPPHRVSASSRRPAPLPFWQIGIMVAVVVVIGALFVRAVRLSLQLSAPPPVQAAAKPALAPVPVPVAPGKTPATVWPKASYPDADENKYGHYYNDQPQGAYNQGAGNGLGDGDSRGEGSYSPPDTSNQNYEGSGDDEDSGSDDSSNATPAPRHFVHHNHRLP